MLLAIGLVVWIIIIIPILAIYRREGRQNAVVYNLDTASIEGVDKIEIFVRIENIDLDQRLGTAYVEFKPIGMYRFENGSLTTDISIQWKLGTAIYPQYSPM